MNWSFVTIHSAISLPLLQKHSLSNQYSPLGKYRAACSSIHSYTMLTMTAPFSLLNLASQRRSSCYYKPGSVTDLVHSTFDICLKRSRSCILWRCSLSSRCCSFRTYSPTMSRLAVSVNVAVLGCRNSMNSSFVTPTSAVESYAPLLPHDDFIKLITWSKFISHPSSPHQLRRFVTSIWSSPFMMLSAILSALKSIISTRPCFSASIFRSSDILFCILFSAKTFAWVYCC